MKTELFRADYFDSTAPCDATQIGRFRAALGEAGMEELLKATVETAVDVGAVRKTEFERIIVDITAQENAIAYPVDSRLLKIARHKVATAAKAAGIALKQTFAAEGKTLRRQAGGYLHANQFKRQRKAVKRQRTIPGILIRAVQRKQSLASGSATTVLSLAVWLKRAERIRTQQRQIMKRAGGGFDASYNAQTALDDTAHIIVAAELSNNGANTHQLVPVLQAVKNNTGELPKQGLADAGYRSEDNFEQLAGLPIEMVVALGREGKQQVQINPQTHPHTAAMATKLQTKRG